MLVGAVNGRLESQWVLALDCQATGASPAHGDVIELGWALCSGEGLVPPLESRFVVPRTARPVRRAVRELTGWSEACLKEALEEGEAYRLLEAGIARFGGEPAPTVIHFARFELGFLLDLHQRLAEGDFPFDVVCLHAVAARLFPELPRRNIRALAGYLGHAPELVRRSAGHVEATAFIWRACLPLLAAVGVSTWVELKAWLAETKAGKRPARRKFPLDSCPVRREHLFDESLVPFRVAAARHLPLQLHRADDVCKQKRLQFGHGAATARGDTDEKPNSLYQ